MPLTIVDWYMSQMLRPREVEDLVRIAAIECSLARTMWTLVHVFHDSAELIQ